jgi:hypothetical protein
MRGEPIEALLAERNATHGSFATNAQLSQHIRPCFVVRRVGQE